MAFIEKLNESEEINLTASVGRDGANSPEDVLVVQALLNFACTGRKFFSKARISSPTGYLDCATIALIERFQRFMKYRLRRHVVVDGRLERAASSSGSSDKRVWTIRCLNVEARIARLKLDAPADNYIQDLCRRFPQVRLCIGQIPEGLLTPSVAAIRIPTGALNLKRA